MFIKLAALIDGLFDRTLTVTTTVTTRQYYPNRPHVSKPSQQVTDTNPTHVNDCSLVVPS